MPRVSHGVSRGGHFAPEWSRHEEVVAVYFNSLGVSKTPVAELIQLKCRTAHLRSRDDVAQKLADVQARHPGLSSDGRRVDTWIRKRVSEATHRTLMAVGAGELDIINNWVCACQ